MANREVYNPYNPFDLREGQHELPAVIRRQPPAIIRTRPQQAIGPIAENSNNNNNHNNHYGAITFDHSPQGRAQHRGRSAQARALRLHGLHSGRDHRNNHPPAYLLRHHRSGWDSDSDVYDDSDDFDFPYYTSDDEDALGLYPYAYHSPSIHRRNRHRHIHLPAGLPLPLPFASNQVVVRRHAAAAAVPQNYGYRRLHYQGGLERGRRNCGARTHHCVPPHGRGQCGGGGGAGGGAAPEGAPNIFKRCARLLFGEAAKCPCGCGGPACGCGGAAAGNVGGAGSRGCCGERPRSVSPTRHREEEYWGPRTQDWAYGPPGSRNTSWRDTPWSSGGNGIIGTQNLAPGAVVEEVEEGGTLPTGTTLAASGDGTHNHYHIGADGCGRRRRDGRTSADDNGLLKMVDRERDRELQRHMFAGERDWADRRDWNQREWSEREAAWKRDMQMLRLLDRERARDHEGTQGITELLDGELERSRIVNPNLDPPDPIILPAPTRPKKAKKLKESKASNGKRDGDRGLKSEVEALRNDLKKFLKSSSKTNSVADEDKNSGSAASSRSRKQSPPTPEIHSKRERTRVIEIEDEDDGDVGDDGEEEDSV